MVKRLFCILLAIVFSFTFALNTSLIAQEEKSEDIEDFSLEELLNVEITTAGKQAEKISEIPASVVLVTREDIEKYGYQTLEEILENIPGLYSTNDYFTTTFGVRGFWSVRANRNVIILVNDIPQTEDVTSGHIFREISVPVEAIDRIEVVRGPMSVIYGAGAFFGVINIKTNLVDEKNPVRMITASFGSEKTAKTAVHFSGKEGDFEYAFSAKYFNTDGLDVEMEKFGGPAFAGLTTKELLENQQKYFLFSGKFKGFYVDASYSEDKKEIFALGPSLTDGTLGKFSSVRFNFGYRDKISDKLSMDARLGYNRGRYEYDFDFGIYGIEDDGTSSFRAEFNLFYEPTPKLNITLGASYQNIFEEVISYAFPAWGLNNVLVNLSAGDSIQTQALFTQVNYKISDKFKIVLGARVERQPEYTMIQKVNQEAGLPAITGTVDLSDAEFIPRLALIYGLNEQNYLKFLYGKAIKRPAFGQNMDMLSNPLMPPLEPENIQTFELNYVGNLSPKFSLSASLFRNMADKLAYRTFFVVDGDLTMYQANVGEMTTNGIEITVNSRPFENFQMELSGTYQDTKDERDGFEDITVGYSPKFLGYLKASYFINKDVSLAVTGNYVDEMEAYYDDTLAVPGRIGEKVDGYFLLGANIRIRNLFGTKLFMNLRGSNLLDEEVHYPATSNNSAFAPLGTVGRGMSFLFTLGWKF